MRPKYYYFCTIFTFKAWVRNAENHGSLRPYCVSYVTGKLFNSVFTTIKQAKSHKVEGQNILQLDSNFNPIRFI